jgi:uncharacterized protein YjbI with pentapeptide repeats
MRLGLLPKLSDLIALSFAFALALAAHAKTGRNAVWKWTDRSAQTHDRAELIRILDAHQKWISSLHKEGQRADLHGANLASADLRKVDLSGANLQGTDLSSADLTDAYIGIGFRGLPNPPMSLAISFKRVPNEPAATLRDLFASFLRSQRFSSPPSNECGWGNAQTPNAADLSDARLRGAVLVNTHWVGANLTGADLTGARLDGAVIQNVELRNANLTDSSLDHAYVSDTHLFNTDLSNADLTNAKLLSSDLNYADMTNAKLGGSTFSGSEVCQVRFEPASIPTDTNSLASVEGLEFLVFENRPEALIAIRQQFREKGFREQERKTTFALKFHDEVQDWNNCSNGSAVACIDLFINRWLFDWTCNYGLNPERALTLLIKVWFFCALIYWWFLRFSSRPSLYLIPSRCLATGAVPHPLLQRVMPRAKKCKTPISGSRKRKGFWTHVRAYARSLCRSAKQTWPLLRAAFFFSTMSAFNIGFRGFAGGRWLRQLTKREYEIKARGWLRVKAGFQALASLGLLALWILTYFGRPFG